MSEHALLSASAAERWINCPGSIALCEGLPDKTSSFAEEGTKAHELAALVLTQEKVSKIPCADEDMWRHVHTYAQQIRDYTGAGTLLVEQRVDYSDVIGVPDSFGTSDAIIISEDGKELLIADLKYGMGVKVDADNNYQLMLYALGALSEYSMIYNIERVRLVISQPRLNHLSEWDCSVETLTEFADKARSAAEKAMCFKTNPIQPHGLNPGEKQCRWCKAKSFCPALTASIQDTLGAGFEDLSITASNIALPTSPDALAAKMAAIPLIENFIKAIRAEVERNLLQGVPVPGYKLVRGKAGNRKWSSEAEAEAVMKQMRLRQEQMYSFDLISVATAEKLFKDNPRQWAKLEGMVTRSEGKVSVAPEDDKRPAITTADANTGFDDVSNNEEGE
jgi:hypothetical protein